MEEQIVTVKQEVPSESEATHERRKQLRRYNTQRLIKKVKVMTAQLAYGGREALIDAIILQEQEAKKQEQTPHKHYFEELDKIAAGTYSK